MRGWDGRSLDGRSFFGALARLAFVGAVVKGSPKQARTSQLLMEGGDDDGMYGG